MSKKNLPSEELQKLPDPIAKNGEAPAELPEAPPGMIALDAPYGYTGHYFIPDPEEGFSARQMVGYYRRNNELVNHPGFIEDSLIPHYRFYCLLKMCEFHLTKRDGTAFPITDEAVLNLEFPDELAFRIYDLLKRPLEAAMVPKN